MDPGEVSPPKAKALDIKRRLVSSPAADYRVTELLLLLKEPQHALGREDLARSLH